MLSRLLQSLGRIAGLHNLMRKVVVKTLRFFVLPLLLLVLAPVMVDATERHMLVEVSRDLSSVEITVHGMGALRGLSNRIWENLTIVSNGRIRGEEVRAIEAGKPITYQVALHHTTPEWGIARWHRNLRLTDWNDWLLTPTAWGMDTPFSLEVHVPREGGAMLPFQLLSIGPGVYQFKAYPIVPDHGGLAVFGNLEVRQAKVAGKTINMAVAGHAAEEREVHFEWIDRVTEVAVAVHGAAPGNDSHVVVIPVPFVSGIVPWAHVRRGGGSHIIAYARSTASLDELLSDWTLFHEMTHLYHPYLRSGGRWVSEGFASYYQNIYRAYGGVVAPDFAYSRLLAGLERGRKENSSDGYSRVTHGARMRTYWTGAALAFEADSLIRAEGGEVKTLAQAIGIVASRHLPSEHTWYPRDYIDALDDAIGKPLLAPLYESYLRDRYFPDPEVDESTIEDIFKRSL